VQRLGDQAQDEDADHDRGDSLEEIESHAQRAGDARPWAGELRHVDGDEDADRDRDHPRQRDDDRRSDDGGADAAARAAELRRVLDEEVEVEGRRAGLDDVEDDDGQHRHRDERGRDGQALSETADDQPPAQVARRGQR
jgi:hypothetical protein